MNPLDKVIARFNRHSWVPSNLLKKKTWNKAHQGPKECARRVRQGKAGTCYGKNSQYTGE